jgi:aralkylamine N-acetyltransferase
MQVGFPRRDAERLKTALDNTHQMVWIRASRQSRFAKLGQLIGFARATSDGALSATIWDVAVLPSWQRLGLGRALIERLTYQLMDDGIPTIALYAEPNVVALYEKLGFAKEPEGIMGMGFLSKSPQARVSLLR